MQHKFYKRDINQTKDTPGILEAKIIKTNASIAKIIITPKPFLFVMCNAGQLCDVVLKTSSERKQP